MYEFYHRLEWNMFYPRLFVFCFVLLFVVYGVACDGFRCAFYFIFHLLPEMFYSRTNYHKHILSQLIVSENIRKSKSQISYILISNIFIESVQCKINKFVKKNRRFQSSHRFEIKQVIALHLNVNMNRIEYISATVLGFHLERNRKLKMYLLPRF